MRCAAALSRADALFSPQRSSRQRPLSVQFSFEDARHRASSFSIDCPFPAARSFLELAACADLVAPDTLLFHTDSVARALTLGASAAHLLQMLDRLLPTLTRPPAFDAVVRVHLKSTFLCTQRFAKHRVAKGGGGRVVNTTSVSGMLGNFGQANYAAAKAGIYGFTRTASIELQKHRITVNCVAPIAKTRMTEDLPMFTNVETLTPDHVAPAVLFLASDACGEKTGWVLAAAGARMYAFRVVETAGRFKEETGGVWTAEEIAEAVVWMLSDRASFMTGASHIIDGGYYAA
jgi:NAD(P)-dependent dehydrogenase (short-subunit alcohol dehydrogenase family)